MCSTENLLIWVLLSLLINMCFLVWFWRSDHLELSNIKVVSDAIILKKKIIIITANHHRSMPILSTFVRVHFEFQTLTCNRVVLYCRYFYLSSVIKAGLNAGVFTYYDVSTLTEVKDLSTSSSRRLLLCFCLLPLLKKIFSALNFY